MKPYLLLAAVAVLFGTSQPPTSHVVGLTRNRFVPAEIRVARGDTVKFVNGEGGPHNVQFEADSMTAAAGTLIDAAMEKTRIRPLMGPLLILQDETWTFVVPALSPGRYPLFCSPHYGNMRGALVVQ